MDGARFDDLTRALAARRTRRGFLAGLAALGGTLAGGPPAPAFAACPSEQVYRQRIGCVCKGTGRPPNGNGCPCANGQVRCGDACRDTARDPANCGACGHTCPPSTDPCRVAICRQGACTTIPAPAGTPCEDGDACTQGDTCDGAGRCRPGVSTDCSSLSDQCSDGVCDSTSGACVPQPKPSGTACDDGDRCTTGDACDGAGRCVGVPVVCDDGLACTASACEATSGACRHPLLAGWCLIGGACVAALARHPDTPCRRCDPIQATDAWSNAPRGAACADTDRCDGDEACDSEGACQPGEPVTCPDPLPCQDAGGCDPTTGACRYALNAADVVCRPAAHACEADARCDGVSSDCPANPAVRCDDGLSCTVDTCDPISGCVHAYTLASFQCLIDDACHPINTPHPANPCRSCQPLVNEVGWSPWPTDGVVPCEPGLACAAEGRCHAGACVATPAAGACLIGGACYAAGDRNPAAPCQGCDPARAADAWTNLPFGASCADDDRCDGAEACDSAGACQPGVPVRCRSPRPCEEEGVCDPDTGTCTFATKTDGAACEDGNLCTLGDTCQAGVCVAGTHRPCDPPEVCHELVGCDPASGECLYWQLGDGTPCGPETDCHIRVCQSGACALVRKPTGAACDDGLTCTTATCQADGACTGAVRAGACLIAGVCYEDGAPHPATPCQICDPAQATDAWTPGSAGTPCDDGLTCTTSTCQADGTCTGAVQADACLIDGACYAAGETQGDSLCVACVPKISQQFWIGLGGVPCGSPCLTDALCSAGVCVGDVTPDTCAIGAACYPAGAHNPANPCWLCDPTRDALDWSRPVLGTYCVIDTRCYPAGAPNPANPCQICDPTQRTNAWSHAPAGVPCETTCRSGGVCSRGICGGTIAGGACAIDGACYAAGDRDPFNPCQACDPLVRQDLWTVLGDDTPCTNHCLANATSTCRNAVCVGETVVACPQPPNLPLCQEVVCDPATGGCVKAGVHLRDDRQGCEICIRCESGICITIPLPVDCGDPAFGSCRVCDPVTGTCVRVPTGADCGSTCTAPQRCDSSGVCQPGAPNPDGVCLNVGECPAKVCDTETARCIETGANDGKACGANGCHECQNGRCVLRPCGDCQRCDPATETCVACEPCCDGRCDWLPCGGQCCAPGLECGRLTVLSDLACLLPCAGERCAGLCCAAGQSCCTTEFGNEICGYPCEGTCYQTPATCCGSLFGIPLRCGDDQICCSTSPTGCCGSHQVCRTNGCAPV